MFEAPLLTVSKNTPCARVPSCRAGFQMPLQWSFFSSTQTIPSIYVDEESGERKGSNCLCYHLVGFFGSDTLKCTYIKF